LAFVIEHAEEENIDHQIENRRTINNDMKHRLGIVTINRSVSMARGSQRYGG
jgi:hypothetical protein